MKAASKTKVELLEEMKELEVRLREAEETLQTTQKKNEELLASARLARTILDQSIDVIVICDESGRITHISQVAHRFFTHKLLGRPFDDACPLALASPSLYEPRQFSISSVLAGKIFRSLEVTYKKDDQVSNFLLSARPFINNGRGILGSIVTLTDITQRRRTELALVAAHAEAEDERRRLETVMEALPVGVAITDARGENIRANRAFEQVWGGPRPPARNIDNDAVYKAWWADTGQEVQPEEWASARAVRKKETVVGQSLQIERFDGTRGFILNSAAPILAADGRVTGSAVAVQDMTTQREAEMKYSKILATALSGFWISDTQGRFLQVNDAFCRMLAYTREELLALSIADVEADESPAHVLNHIAVLRQKKSDRFVSRHRRKDGSILDVEVNSTWLDIGGGQLVGFMHDITDRKKMEEELRHSRDELEIRVQERTKEVRDQSRVLDSFFKFSITPFVILDKNFNFIHVNEAYAKACHREASEFLGHNHFEFYPSDAKAKFEQVVQTKKPYVAIARPFSFPDHPKWGISYWDWTLTPILDDMGEVEYLVFSLEDVTQRKWAEEALRTAHQYNRRLIEASLDPLITINPEGKVTDVNSATELATGVLREQLIGSDFSNYFADPEKAREVYRTVFLKGTVRDYPLAIRHKSGLTTDVLYNATIYRNEAGEIQGVFAAARDITERKRAEEALKESENRLRALSSQLLTAQESERKRIALELHDGIGQMLTAIKFKVESILEEKGKGKASAKEKSLEAIIPMVRETVEEARRMQMDLRPSTLDDLGVLATLGWFCREYQKIYSHIQIEKEIGLQENDISVPRKVVIYRMTQEAMNNIAKHSQANLVRLSLAKKENDIELVIRDNGAGFDLEEVLSPERSKRGLGLASMRERIELSGGTFALDSTVGKGTTIRASWPL